MRVCVLDSGVEDGHPRVGAVARAVAITVGEDGEPIATDDLEGDLCGHGTACAGVVHSLAPEAEIHSVRVLGAGFSGSGRVLLAGLRWAVERGLRRDQHEPLDDEARSSARRCTSSPTAPTSSARSLVASAHNMPVESLPVALLVRDLGRRATRRTIRSSSTRTRTRRSSSSRAESTSRSRWLGGGTIRATGNSFATPCIAGIAALILSKHPGLTPFQLKTVLYLISTNVGGSDA